MKFLLVIATLFFQYSINAANQDSGIDLTAPSKLAPLQTNEFNFALGSWQIEETNFSKDGKTSIRNGFSKITFVNRGHGYIENSTLVDESNISDYTISFFAFGKVTQKWMMGRVNERREAVEMYDGVLENKMLVFKSAVRRSGGIDVTLIRISYVQKKASDFAVIIEESIDYGKSWVAVSETIYNKTKRDLTSTFKNTRTENDKRSKEQKQFDFLIGDGKATQSIQLPTGKWIKFPASASAERVLNGKAIYEYNWYNVDKRNPETATSIIRIYNRNMRRWETLFYSNRANTLFFFGGKKEGDRIVLHNFETHSENIFSKWIFYDIKEKGYRWFAESSTDGGKIFNKTWEIVVDF